MGYRSRINGFNYSDKPTRWMYVLKTRNVHKSAFQFLISSLKVLSDDPFLMFF